MVDKAVEGPCPHWADPWFWERGIARPMPPRDYPELDVHSHGVYRPDYDEMGGALVGMMVCAITGFAVGLLVGWWLL